MVNYLSIFLCLSSVCPSNSSALLDSSTSNKSCRKDWPTAFTDVNANEPQRANQSPSPASWADPALRGNFEMDQRTFTHCLYSNGFWAERHPKPDDNMFRVKMYILHGCMPVFLFKAVGDLVDTACSHLLYDQWLHQYYIIHFHSFVNFCK